MHGICRVRAACDQAVAAHTLPAAWTAGIPAAQPPPISLLCCPCAEDGDWFLRLAAWLLWLKRNAQGPWRLYIDLLPKVGAEGFHGAHPDQHMLPSMSTCLASISLRHGGAWASEAHTWPSACKALTPGGLSWFLVPSQPHINHHHAERRRRR